MAQINRPIAIQLACALAERQRRIQRNAAWAFKPYGWQSKFFAAGAKYLQRLGMAANQVGKTTLGAIETVYHLTGVYPKDWRGRVFREPGEWWAGSNTAETTRDVVQAKLLGTPGVNDSFGYLPGDLITSSTTRRGTPNAIDTVVVKHISGGESLLQFKSYDQGREKWQGTAKHGIWCDEEPPMDIYTEASTRTLDTDGLVLVTFTPLKGMSDVVLKFMDNAHDTGAENVIVATWDDAPHLSASARKSLWDSLPPYQRDARSKGVPAIGSGLIWPVDETIVTVEPLAIPAHWPRLFALDVGWNRTACLWGALDRDSDTLYLYSEYYMSEEKPPVHASAIRSRGGWIPGVFDPAARGRAQKDGEQLSEIYRKLLPGMSLTPAINGVEAGVFNVWERLSTGRLKVFKSLENWLKEYRMYHRDERGSIVKKNDHLMDCTRYLCMGLGKARQKPAAEMAGIIAEKEPDEDGIYW